MKKKQAESKLLLRWCSAAYAVCVLAVYPLYIHTFVDLGLTKFTGYVALSAVWLLAFVAAGVVALCGVQEFSGTKGLLKRWSGPLAVLITTLLSTLFALEPQASFWGLEGYYGGCMLVILGILGYSAVRLWTDPADHRLILGSMAVTGALVTVFNVLHLVDVDPLGAYEGIAASEKSQFYSTIGQMDFVASFLSLTLPVSVYGFLAARSRAGLTFYGVCASLHMLALASASADCLLLGTLAFAAVLVCLPGFDTVRLRRLFLCGAFLAGFNLALYLLRQSGVEFNVAGTPLVWELSAREKAIPLGALCLLGWACLFLHGRHHGAVSLSRAGRIVTAVCAAAVVLLIVAANLLPDVVLHGALRDKLVFNESWGNGRGEAWQAVVSAYGDAPLWRKLLGYGTGMMHRAVEQWCGGNWTGKLNTFYAAHSEYLELLLCGGLAGLAAWVWFAAGSLRRGILHSADPAAAAMTLALVSYLAQSAVNIRVSMVFPEVLVLLGLLDGAVCSAGMQTGTPLPDGRIRRFWPLMVLAGAWAVRPVLWPLSHLLCAFLWG